MAASAEVKGGIFFSGLTEFSFMLRLRTRTLLLGLLVIAGTAVAVTGPLATGGLPIAAAGNQSNATWPSMPTLDATNSGPNETRLEHLIHREINRQRTNRALSNLSYDRDLAEIAAYHSRDMANNSYFAHTAPDGETMPKRYARFGYDCRADMGDGRYATGGENIAKTYYHEQLTNGRYYSTLEELAKGIVEQWMNSPPHRENILRPYWNAEGIGVDVVETENGTAVYATQNFC